jgi:predicted nucleotidyltransferase
MPKMGSRGTRKAKQPSVADALFSKTQQRVLGLFFGQPERAFAKQELIHLTGSGSGAVQRELERLLQTGLVSVSVAGFQKLYRANPAASIYAELRGIVDKTMGVASAVQRALTPLRDKLRLAVLFGSVAKETDTATSDVDVLVVSDDLHLEDLYTALQHVESKLDRRVSPTLYTTQEFKQKRRAQQPFITKVMSGKHVVLLGSEDAF